jgi:mono/diheme cytochrome c family protein
MYTGIIQDAQFVGPQSYLRKKIEQYDLDKHHNWGRIWRITYEGMEPDRRPPQMYKDTSARLVEYLGHPNGWWRDTAQKLLVLRQDKSVVKSLETMARSNANQLARIHALWTLEGLNALSAPLARQMMKDSDPQIRIQAIRASESLYKARDKSFAADYRAMTKDSDPNVVIQAMLTLNLQRVPDAAAAIRATMDASTARGVKEIGDQIVHPRNNSQGQRPSLADTGAGSVNLSTDQRRMLQRGDSTYRELCGTCHGPDGKGAPMAGTEGGLLAPPLAGSPRVLEHRDYVIKVLLNGLTGPLDGRNYSGGVMVAMGSNTDEWIADIASYVRNTFGNTAPFVTPDQVAAVRKTASRKTPWTFAEVDRTIPKPLTNTAQWKLTASHNADAASNVVKTDGSRWDSGGQQQPGTWFQIELPEPAPIVEMQVDASVPGLAGRGRGPQPAGGRGRGGFVLPATGPIAYTVQTSMDGTTWSTPIAQGTGQTPTTLITFPSTQARFIRITQTGTGTNQLPWGIQRIHIYSLR